MMGMPTGVRSFYSIELYNVPSAEHVMDFCTESNYEDFPVCVQDLNRLLLKDVSSGQVLV